MANHLVQIGRGMEAHSSGSLWLPEPGIALVADLHLGYSWAQRRRGELGPLADIRTGEKLFRLCDELQPRQIVFLGDVVHAPRPCQPEREWIELTLNDLSRRTELVSVRGNHDRSFAREFGHLPLQNVESWCHGDVTAVHGDRFTFAWPEGHTLILGHLHPSMPVRDAAGASRRLPIFLATDQCVVLPAFSPFARGYDVAAGLPREISTCFRGQQVAAFAATGNRVVSLGPLGDLLERMWAADVSNPARFRGVRRFG